MKYLIVAFACVASLTFPAIAQPSVTLNIGPTYSAHGPDTYALNNPWPTTGSTGTDNQQLTFFSGGTGLLAKLGLMWEISDHFAAGMMFQTVQWSMPENQRTSGMVSIGAEFRINFVSSTKNVVPYFQGAYLFSNSSTVEQKQATGIGTQVQPAFSVSQSSSVGFGADLGVEFKITNSLGLLVNGGYHGIEAVSDHTFVSSLDYGSFTAPQGFDGVFFYAFAGGVKYYFGRGVKKRDF